MTRLRRIAGKARPEVVAEIVACLERGAVIAIDDPAVVPPPLPDALPGAAVVLHTSGTTGDAKRVQLSRAALMASAEATWRALGRRAGDRWLCCLSLARIGGLSIITRCMASDCEPVLVERFDVEAVIEAIESERVTLISLVPTMLELLLSRAPAWQPPDHLRACLVGGAPASDDLLDRARQRGVPVVTAYGMTETCSHVALDGVLVDRARAQVIDGRIAISGPMLALECGPWFVTGDAGEIDSTGKLIVYGRADDAILSAGETIHPAQVERELDRAGVGPTCVFGVPDPIWGEIVAAAVVGPPEQLRGMSDRAAALPSRIRPRLWAAVRSLPTTAAGKLDRRAVARAAAQGGFALIR